MTDQGAEAQLDKLRVAVRGAQSPEAWENIWGFAVGQRNGILIPGLISKAAKHPDKVEEFLSYWKQWEQIERRVQCCTGDVDSPSTRDHPSETSCQDGQIAEPVPYETAGEFFDDYIGILESIWGPIKK